MTTISIAMATYNGARFIREQLNSLAAQTELPSELVVTDDGSTDNTIEIVSEFARNAPFPVSVFPGNQRLGFRANFMNCASLCSGDLISFCDQDDVWQTQDLKIWSDILTTPASSWLVTMSLLLMSTAAILARRSIKLIKSGKILFVICFHLPIVMASLKFFEEASFLFRSTGFSLQIA
jgi:glycosyltransferase involved in cell wall biosynthesis